MRRMRMSRRMKRLTKMNYDSIVKVLALSPSTHKSHLLSIYYKHFLQNTSSYSMCMQIMEEMVYIYLQPLYLQKVDVDGKQTCLSWEPIRRLFSASGFRHVKSPTTIPDHILYRMRHFYGGHCPFAFLETPITFHLLLPTHLTSWN
jgi:hypothetical protein